MHWYFKLLARKPHLIILAIIVVSVACCVVSFTKTFPDFSDPTLGFESRGTVIGQRLTAWKNLLYETGPSGVFVANPADLVAVPEYPYKKHRPKQPKKNEKKKKKKEKLKFNKKIKFINKLNTMNASVNYDLVNFGEYDDNETFSLRHDHYDYGKNLSYVAEDVNNERIQLKKNQWKSLLNLHPPQTTNIHIPTDGFFCESPSKEFSHFIIKRVNHNLTESMLEINALLATCDLEQRFTETQEYRHICQQELTSSNCCRPWTLPNYVAFLSNRTSCFDIEESDVQNVKLLLLECFQYYHNLKLGNDCTQSKSCRVPTHCAQSNAVYNILHYLTDIDFIKQNDTNEFLSFTMIFLPIARSTKSLKYYHDIMDISLSNDLVAVAAMDMGLKNALFDEYLLLDGWLVGLGGIFITICMWMYTTSLFVTVMSIIAVLFSLGVTYFIYTIVFELSFFPFMNLLAVIVVVGIGADDAFIFVKIWQCVLLERVKSSGLASTSDYRHSDVLVQTMSNTFRHAALSMLVTSLTTACAFYASFVSSITAVKCFGIFSGTAIMTNYLLMITWLPASISIAEKLSCLSLKFNSITVLRLNIFKSLSHIGTRVEDGIVSLVLYLPYLCICVLGCVGVVSCMLVFYWPKLKLPDSSDFKLFASNHPFEIYDSDFKNLFWFEKMYTSLDTFKLPLRFVWGILPVDQGNYFDPFSRGHLYLDNTFNVSSIESQIWLLNFCKDLKNQTFYSTTMSPLLPNCFIENFITWMGRRCMDNMANIDRTPCCEVSSFPFDPVIFDQCILESISSLYETPREFFIPGVAGPKFSRNQQSVVGSDNDSSTIVLATVKAIVIEYDSNQAYTMSYTSMSDFFLSVETWFTNQLATAPENMKMGWFVSDLDFYDLQRTLSTGTLISIALGMCVALLVLLLVTLNILVSLYAIITVTFTITTTIAVLILLGWKLNVLESVAVSSAIGLAVDFSLHYGVHYRFSPDTDRKAATKFSLKRMIGPTAMAATTTGVAGALMLPSNVLAYIQIGIFLVVVMMVSWIYATFFLMSLLRVIGPQFGFGQFQYPSFGNNRDNSANKTVLQDNRSNHQSIGSEKLLSAASSAAGDLIGGSETHELDSLTSNSVMKSLSLENSQPINFDRVVKKKYPYPRENSPSTVSAITMIIPDDVDVKH